MRVPNGSTVFITPAGSGLNIAVTASGNPVNLAGYYGAMLIATTASNGGGATGVTFKVFRSATSNGTYAAFGASVPGITAGSMGVTAVRNFLVNTSATWHRVVSNNNAGGSYSPVAYLLGFRGVVEPVTTQSTLVTTYSDVLSG